MLIFLNHIKYHLIQSIFKNSVVSRLINKNIDEDNNDNFTIKLGEEHKLDLNEEKLTIFLTDNIYENIYYLISNHKEINNIVSKLKEHIPKKIKKDENAKCNSKNCWEVVVVKKK